MAETRASHWQLGTEHWRQIVEAVPYGVSVVNVEGVHVAVNDAMCRLTGFARDELVGVGPPHPYWPEDELPNIQAAFALANAGEPADFELVFCRKGGARFPVLVHPTALDGADGRPELFVATVSDMSAQRRLEHELVSIETERHRHEQALREGTERFRVVVDAALDAVVATSGSGHITVWNAQAEELFGWTRPEVLGRKLSELIIPARVRDAYEQGLKRYLVDGTSSMLSRRIEVLALRKNGEEFPVELSITPARVGSTVLFSAFLRDLTERRRSEEKNTKLEAQLQQAVKLQSVGRLAGGVAHDFNNMLVVILGHAEAALGQLDPSRAIHADLVEIRNAALRSADLTRQLLAFARQQTVAPQVLDLNETVGEMLKMLPRLLGEDVHLTWKPAADLWAVMMDRFQVDQILTNLCVNARDAIADVGTIAIETANRVVDTSYCADHPDAVPGEYVRLTVSDDGRGMTEEVLAQIFEPFFTTKDVGKGTGLGLATVYGATRQNLGFVDVSSTHGKGSAFAIHLPRYVDKSVSKDPRPRVALAPTQRGKETILLVEDEPAILRITARLLEARGYAVIQASGASEALRVAKAHGETIHLLITDVIMPGMNGRDLANALQSLDPHLQCMFMSGYPADVITHRGVLDEGVWFIQKPFPGSELSAKVREVLDSRLPS